MGAFRFSPNKYGAHKTDDGFPSKLEKAVYIKLLDQQMCGLISDLKRQQTVILQEGKRETRIAWRLDFSFVNRETGALEYAEAKGVETGEYKLKLKLWRANPPAPLSIWKGNWRKPKLVERIERRESDIDSDAQKEL
jgi:hypothetical protein